MRIRTIKPAFFLHPGLHDLEQKTKLPVRIAFIGLWCAADREGRFVWEHRQLGVQILPYAEIDFSLILDALQSGGFIVRYGDKMQYGWIPSFKEHQHINLRESPSKIPPYESSERTCNVATCEVQESQPARAGTCMHVIARGEGKGREGKGKEGKEATHTQNDASIPTLSEVQTAGAMMGATPEQSERFWNWHEGQNTWLNQHGRLINWRLKLKTWVEDDRKPKSKTQNAIAEKFIDRNIGTANEGKAHLYEGLGRE